MKICSVTYFLRVYGKAVTKSGTGTWGLGRGTGTWDAGPRGHGREHAPGLKDVGLEDVKNKHHLIFALNL